jgi:hypothetical protein
MSVPNAVPGLSNIPRARDRARIAPYINIVRKQVLTGASLIGNASQMFLAWVQELTATYQVKTSSSVFMIAARQFAYFL